MEWNIRFSMLKFISLLICFNKCSNFMLQFVVVQKIYLKIIFLFYFFHIEKFATGFDQITNTMNPLFEPVRVIYISLKDICIVPNNRFHYISVCLNFMKTV